MKELFILFLCLFVCMIPGLCQEEDIPAWFLSPPAGEYVGVSLPLETVSQRENSALAAALLSYFAVHPGELTDTVSTVTGFQSVYDNGQSRRNRSMSINASGVAEKTAQERFTRTLTQKIGYRIVQLSWRSRCTCSLSLHVAYVKCLFSLLRQENRSVYRMGVFDNVLYLL